MDDTTGWKSILAAVAQRDSFPIPAYSEFMPAPRLGPRPLGEWETASFDPADPWGLQISEAETAWGSSPASSTSPTRCSAPSPVWPPGSRHL